MNRDIAESMQLALDEFQSASGEMKPLVEEGRAIHKRIQGENIESKELESLQKTFKGLMERLKSIRARWKAILQKKAEAFEEGERIIKDAHYTGTVKDVRKISGKWVVTVELDHGGTVRMNPLGIRRQNENPESFLLAEEMGSFIAEYISNIYEKNFFTLFLSRIWETPVAKDSLLKALNKFQLPNDSGVQSEIFDTFIENASKARREVASRMRNKFYEKAYQTCVEKPEQTTQEKQNEWASIAEGIATPILINEIDSAVSRVWQNRR